jgi:hypothetical protein
LRFRCSFFPRLGSLFSSIGDKSMVRL